MRRVEVFIYYLVSILIINTITEQSPRTSFLMISAAGIVLFFHWAENKGER